MMTTGIGRNWIRDVQVPLYIGLYSPKGMRVLHVSDGLCHMLQRSHAQAAAYFSQPLEQLVHTDDAERVRRALARAAEEPGSYQQASFRMHLHDADAYSWVLAGCAADMSHLGSSLMYVNLFDVTSEHTLREEHEYHSRHVNMLLEKILSTTQTALFWKDKERRFLGANKAFLDYYGFPSEAVIVGKTDEDMGWHEDDDPFRDDEIWILETGNSTCRVHGKCRSHGEMRDILASKSPIIEDGEIVGLVGSFEDVTDEYRQQQRIVELNDELMENIKKVERADAVKMGFLANVSHDMRTPLNGILGYAELAQGHTSEPEVMRDYIAKIKASGEFLLDLVNDTLEMSRITSGKLQLDLEHLPAQHIFDKMLLAVRPVAAQKGINLIEDIELADLGVVAVDALKLTKVMLNFLSNALKFTPDGGMVRFTARLLPDSEGNRHHCRFVVSDNGIGMSQEFVPRMFEPFAQEQAASDLGAMGTGLGLTIAKKLMDLMGGVIDVQSCKGAGTTITSDVWLEKVGDVQAPAAAAVEPESIALAGRHILICEDNPLNLEIIVSLLELQDMVIVQAANGWEGLQRFRESGRGELDAILIDVRMPVMDGLEATRTIRALQRPDAAEIPIIALSANAFHEDIAKSEAAGMTAYLTKPVDMQALTQSLKQNIAAYDRVRREKGIRPAAPDSPAG